VVAGADEMTKLTKLVTAAVIEREGRFLITQRLPDSAHLPGAWEFPGGKIEPDEDPRDCLAREVMEETGVRSEVGGIADVSFYRYEEFNVLVLFYSCRITEGEPYPKDCAAVKWIAADEFPLYRFPAADVAVIEKIRGRGI
jgi:8-oxo-dGTP diphosphatase